MCANLYFFLIVCNKPHANPTIIYENIKEIHILAVVGTLEFPILSHVLLRRESLHIDKIHKYKIIYNYIIDNIIIPTQNSTCVIFVDNNLNSK